MAEAQWVLYQDGPNDYRLRSRSGALFPVDSPKLLDWYCDRFHVVRLPVADHGHRSEWVLIGAEENLLWLWGSLGET